MRDFYDVLIPVNPVDASAPHQAPFYGKKKHGMQRSGIANSLKDTVPFATLSADFDI